MNYSAPEFLLVLPIYCVLFWALRDGRARLTWLLAGSLAFYAYGSSSDVIYLLATIALAYSAGLLIEAAPARRTLVVGATVTVLVGGLAYFKYGAYVAAMVTATPWDRLAPPLGISFFTFEVIAYVVDLKRGVTRAERSPLRLALFIAVFPHLISGPIMRPNDLIPQLRRALRWHLPTFVSGLQLFVEGLVKKRLLADPAGRIVDAAFADPGQIGTAAAWLAALAYTVQIYGDFSGYTDMGRGVARMLGLELPLNFNAPYAARSITEFWRRWHISLSSWLRDYVYIPLGGNRGGAVRTYANVVATMLIGGLWHGAGITFLIWGGYHGVLLALERRLKPAIRPAGWLAQLVTLFLVVNGWVLFRAQDLVVFGQILKAMYVPRAGGIVSLRDVAFVVVAFGLVVGAMALHYRRPAALESLRGMGTRGGALYGVLAGIALIVIVTAPTATRPFIYFRF